MIDLSTAFDTYLKKIEAIQNERKIQKSATKKPAKVNRNDFEDDVTYYLAKAEEAKALELLKEDTKNKQAEFLNFLVKEDEALEEFKDILFSEYSEYSKASLEKVFNHIQYEYKSERYNWLTAFEEEMEFITEFNELNNS